MHYDNKRLALSIFWVLLGAVLMGLSVTEVLDSSIYSCMGGALMGVGVLQIIKVARYRRDSGYRERVDTEISDERNRFLRMKSWSWTGYIVVLIEALGSIAALILGQHTIQLMLSYSVCLIITIYWIMFLILSRKY